MFARAVGGESFGGCRCEQSLVGSYEGGHRSNRLRRHSRRGQLYGVEGAERILLDESPRQRQHIGVERNNPVKAQ